MFKRIFSWPIKVHLFILVLASVLPALGIIILTGMERRDRAIEDAKCGITRLTDGLAIQQEQISNSTRQLLMTLARIPAVQEQDARACNRFLSDLLRENPSYAAISIATSQGTVFASAPAVAPFDISERKYFHDVMQTGDFSVGEYILSVSAHRPVFHYAYPVVHHGGRIRAVVVAAFDASHYSKLFATAKLPIGSALGLTDGSGVRLYRYPDFEKHAGTKDLPEMMERMTSGEVKGTFFARGVDGRQRLYGFRRLSLPGKAEPYLFIRVGIPEEMALAEANAALISNLRFLGIAAALAMVLAYLMGRFFIVQPLDVLVKTSRQIGHGDLVVRTGLAHMKNEVGHLARSFDEMASMLEDHESERRWAEERIEQLKLDRERILYSAGEGIIGINADGDHTFVNPAAAQMLGYEIDELVGKNSHSIYHHSKVDGSPYPESECPIYGAYRDGKIHRAADEVFWKRDGDKFPVEYTSTPIMENGMPVGAVLTFKDISARKQAEESIRESEERYRTLAEKSMAGVYVFQEGVFRFLNTNAASYAGYLPEDLIGCNSSAIVHPDDRELVRKNASMMIGGGRKSPYEFRIITKDGKVRWIMESVAKIQYHGKPAILGNSMDITDIIETKQELELQKALESSILDAVPQAVIGLQNHRIIFASNRSHDVFGWAPEELTGRTTRIFSASDKDHEEMEKAVYSALKKQRTYYMEQECRRKDGADITCLLNVAVIGDRLEDNRIVVTYEDITLQKRAASEHQKTEAQLRQAQKMEAMGTLAGGIAHDFNNILSGIIGYTELYKEQMHDHPKVYHAMDEVLNAANRAKDLVQQILLFSRQTEKEKKPVKLIPLIKEVTKFIRASLPTTIEIRHSLSATSDVIKADITQMHQVLMNFCTNAAHAMKEKGGILEITLKEVDITAEEIPLLSLNEGKYLRLTVRDTGEGIPPEHLERIFEPYFTTKKKGEGTGLGLSVVDSIIKGHGGAINVYSELGKGSAFNVYLPLLEGQKVVDEKKDMAPLPRGSETILFVDDEMMLAQLGKLSLEKLGYKVVIETDPAHAIALFKEHKEAFDLVVTDKTMPHMSGYDLAHEIKSIRADIPVILCSGSQDKDESGILSALGINCFITKPIRMNEMAAAIRSGLDANQGKDKQLKNICKNDYLRHDHWKSIH